MNSFWHSFKPKLRSFRMNLHAMVDPAEMVYLIVIVFLVAVFGAAFAPTLATQVTRWSANLTGNSAPAASLVNIVPLIFWIIIAAALVLSFVGLIRHSRSKGV